MDYIKGLVKTPAGLQMLETLDTSKFETLIQYGEGGNSDPWRQQKDDEEPPLRSPHR